MANKVSIGRLELDHNGRWLAHMADGYAWIVSNPEEVPASQLDDCQYHLFAYNPDDQFCRWVSPEEANDAFSQYQTYLDANGHESYQDAITR